MKRKFPTLLLAFVLCLALLPAAWAAEPAAAAAVTASEPSADGDGYYLISTYAELVWFQQYVAKTDSSACARLTADIVANENVLNSDGSLNGTPEITWTPIGNSSKAYSGTFDGQEHTISGLYYSDSKNYIGLFAYCSGATIKNVGIIDSFFSGGIRIGGICGKTYTNSTATTIINCYNTGTVTGKQYVGGICGENFTSSRASEGSRIEKCYNTGTITGTSAGYVGGICGYNDGTTSSVGSVITDCFNSGAVVEESTSVSYTGGICGMNKDQYAVVENCYNTGTVNSNGAEIGGIVGGNVSSATVTDCHNTGIVSGNGSKSESVGGIVGYTDSSATTTCCYNLGAIYGTGNIGGVCGYGSGAVVENCYNAGAISGSGGRIGGVIGYNAGSATVSYCHSTGSVSSKDSGGNVGGVCGLNSGSSSICCAYFNTDVYSGYAIGSGSETAEEVAGKTADQFASGEVAWLLNGSSSDGVWKQTLSTDSYPGFAGETVYYSEAQTKYYNESDSSEEKTAELYGYSLSLDGNVGMHFYIALSDAAKADTTAVMNFTLPSQKSSSMTVAEASQNTEEIDGTTCYTFSCEVAAKEMTDEVIAQITFSDGTQSEVYTYSVQQYAKTVLKNEENDESFTKAASLVQAMLNYGAYAQTYFAHTENGLANAGYETSTAVEAVTAEDLKPYVYQLTGESENVEFYGANLVTLSETTLKLYFLLKTDVSIDTLRFTLDGNAVTPTAVGSLYCVEIPNISSSKLGVASLVVADGLTVSYSALSYAYQVLRTEAAGVENGAALQNAVKALYLYQQAATAYFGS